MWFDEYVQSLCERTQKHLKAPRVPSEIQPTKGDVVPLKGNASRVSWKLGKIEELVTSKADHQLKYLRLATVKTAPAKYSC